MENSIWSAPTNPGPLAAVVSLPGSKSLTARALILALLSQQPSKLRGVLKCRDSRLMMDGMVAVGAEVSERDGITSIIPPLKTGFVDMLETDHEPISIYCGLSGTVMRFLPPAIFALGLGPVIFDGDPTARKRPMKPLLDALVQLGAKVSYLGREGFLPFRIDGNWQGGKAVVECERSSQFLSALLLAAPAAPKATEITVKGHIPSAPHVAMTLGVLERAGIKIAGLNRDDILSGKYAINPSWKIEPQSFSIDRLVIEPDLTNAGPFLAAALICGGEVQVKEWPLETEQAGDYWRKILPLMGAEKIHLEETAEKGVALLSVKGTGVVQGVEIEMSDYGELVPTIAALATLADSPSRITGIAHLRGHETDRLTALAKEINRLGGNVKEGKDYLEIIPGKSLQPVALESYHDHRLAMFGAIIGLGVPGTGVYDMETVGKTFPTFIQVWHDMLSQLEEIDNNTKGMCLA